MSINKNDFKMASIYFNQLCFIEEKDVLFCTIASVIQVLFVCKIYPNLPYDFKIQISVLLFAFLEKKKCINKFSAYF